MVGNFVQISVSELSNNPSLTVINMILKFLKVEILIFLSKGGELVMSSSWVRGGFITYGLRVL